ncbi:MAG: hypothetical protein MUC50_01090, partial [Myxococcota bacterium]|nr:hypothetical protein [Myxococcota bacterium]
MGEKRPSYSGQLGTKTGCSGRFCGGASEPGATTMGLVRMHFEDQVHFVTNRCEQEQYLLKPT